jgi:hypothetical protein
VVVVDFGDGEDHHNNRDDEHDNKPKTCHTKPPEQKFINQ